MKDNPRGSILGLLVVATLFAGEAYADTFEFLTYTPPSGWTNQAVADKTTYQRKSGIGAIIFYASYPATGSVSDEFAKMWRARLEPTLTGTTPPQPQIEREGDYTVAFGQQQFDAQGTVTTVVLAAFVGRGRALGVLSISAGDNVLREVTAFYDSLDITPGNSVNPAPSSSSTSVSEIEVEFAVPPGYVQKREGKTIVLTPTTFNDKTPCVYGISPSRTSKGSLEADARAAILEPLPGWQIKDESFNAMRGVAGAGWKYFWFRAMAQGLVGGSYQSVYAMAMAFPAGAEPGRVNIVWGFGPIAKPRCQLDDLAFAQLFQSLRPRGWTSDGGKALAQELQKTWQNSQSVGIARFKFMDNGRYDFGMGTSARIGMTETTVSGVSDGSYKLDGDVLTITPDRGTGRGVSKYRVRIYDDYFAGKWWRKMSLLDESANPALIILYDQIEN